MPIHAIFFDLGDTIMVEESEVKDENLTTLRADLVPGMAGVLRMLKASGHRLALVADTKSGTYRNVLQQHKLFDLFDAIAVSDELGVEKPAKEIFQHALNRLGIQIQQYGQVLMVGNNLQRDIAGANRLGLMSVWFRWNDRYPTEPRTPEEQPVYTVESPEELVGLVDRLESNAEQQEGGRDGES